MNLHAKWFDVSKDKKVFLKVPKNYKVVKDSWEVPLMLFSPMSPKGGRASIVVMPTPYKFPNIKEDILRKHEGDYRDGRERYLSKRGGKSIKYFPYNVEKWKGVEQVHTIGYQYTMNNILFTEKSFHFQCNDQFFMMKSLYREESFKNQESKIKNIIKSFKCGNK